MTSEFPAHFARNYQCLLNCLKLHGMQPKTIALYSHGVRRAAVYFRRIGDRPEWHLLKLFWVSILLHLCPCHIPWFCQ
jgi:hypothetical protein